MCLLFIFMFNSLIEKLLKKRGIEDVEKLSPEEKETFKSWELVLNKEELTTDDIKKFLQSQISAIENKWKDFDVLKEKKADLISQFTIYKTLLLVMDSPKVARESLEIQLQQMLNN